MNRKSVSTFLSIAFLIVIICSTILPVFSLKNNVNISSNGTVNYSGLSLERWNLVVTVTPIDGGLTSVSGTRSIPAGQSISIVATPASGYIFSKWLLDSTPSSSNPITIQSQPTGSTHSLVAVFATTMTNAVWLDPDWDPNWNPASYVISSAMLDRLVNSKTFLLFLEVGRWDGQQITYWYSDAQMSNMLNTIRQRSPNFEIHAYVFAGSAWSNPVPDISTLANRQAMINQAIACVNKGFDGFHDDIEGYVGTTQNYIDWLNGMSMAIRNKGKHSSAAIAYFEPSVFPSVNLDYSAVMFYTSVPLAEGTFKSSMNTILTSSASPVIIGVLRTSLSSQLSWITEQSSSVNYPKYVGASVFCFETMTATDWTVWTNWSMN